MNTTKNTPSSPNVFGAQNIAHGGVALVLGLSAILMLTRRGLYLPLLIWTSGLRQNEIARRVGASQATVLSWAHGGAVSKPFRRPLAALLGVRPEALPVSHQRVAGVAGRRAGRLWRPS